MIILDVREKDEFETENVPGSIFCPLSEFSLLAPGILNHLKNSDVTIMCRSGKRAKLALAEIEKLGLSPERYSVYEGGIIQWKLSGGQVQGKAKALPLMRQVQIVAGLLIILSVLGQVFLAPSFIYLAAFVGTGLTVAGITGFCGMAIILQRMPWNRSSSKAGETICGC